MYASPPHWLRAPKNDQSTVSMDQEPLSGSQCGSQCAAQARRWPYLELVSAAYWPAWRRLEEAYAALHMLSVWTVDSHPGLFT